MQNQPYSKIAQRKRNVFWTASLCLHYPTRAGYATIRQRNYFFEQKPAESNILHQETYSRKTLRELTTEYSNAHRVLKLEVLVRITKMIPRLDHSQKYNMRTSASSHASLRLYESQWRKPCLLIIHVNVSNRPVRNRRYSNMLNGNAISSEQLVSVCTIQRGQSRVQYNSATKLYFWTETSWEQYITPRNVLKKNASVDQDWIFQWTQGP